MIHEFSFNIIVMNQQLHQVDRRGVQQTTVVVLMLIHRLPQVVFDIQSLIPQMLGELLLVWIGLLHTITPTS